MTPTREPLSRDRVLRAALALADAGGTDALTMRRLGQELGVEAMSLYRHVANKDAVLAGIVDLVIGEITLPSTADGWKEAMRSRGATAHQVLMRHPWAPALLMSRTNTGPAMLRYIDFTLGALREAGFSWQLTDYAWNTMDSYIYGFTLRKLSFPIAEADYAEVASAHLHMLAGGQFPYMAEMTRLVGAGNHPGEPDLAFGLDLILDGLERLRG
ncbi:TetR/AcrR family transcriptional regulator C-terminal domain-containing protein [Actinoplanes sp. NPDC024001]|uniref:TetR/AcrR family transcriptional regulator C-terminal domain-containing protein n=1 Tax=Actinoplanes sp. NPDC024001 TaxID=3154598 RepID=UPI0033F1DDB5